MLKLPSPKIVGIMVSPEQAEPPFAGQRFFAHLCQLGAKWNILVIVFSPLHTDLLSETVEGYKFESRCWVKAAFPMPDLIYDRAFFTNSQHYQLHTAALSSLQQLRRIPLLGRSLKGKWSVHKVLSQDPELAFHLPKTELVRKPAQIFQQFKAQSAIVLKPDASSQGKGILIATKAGVNEYLIKGRNSLNRPISEAFDNPFVFIQWLLAFIGQRKYLLQQYLSLHTDQGDVFDVRVLMQKGYRGNWMQTGMAARVGQPNSMTSNLHGGGTGSHVYPFLFTQFGEDKAKSIIAIINRLSSNIPSLLEQHFGRLVELGIDIGIDKSGQVWIIEVNSKPGRAAARWFAQPEALDRAMSNPMQYARFLLQSAAIQGTILGG